MTKRLSMAAAILGVLMFGVRRGYLGILPAIALWLVTYYFTCVPLILADLRGNHAEGGN